MKEKLFSLTKKDFEIQTFRSGGKGGQHQNKVESGVRIVHRESGAVGESREQRSQLQNKKTAFIRLTEHPKFKVWIQKRVYEIIEKETIDEKVEEAVKSENLKIEVINSEGQWEEINEDVLA
jgi:protein subunit release factor B